MSVKVADEDWQVTLAGLRDDSSFVRYPSIQTHITSSASISPSPSDFITFILNFCSIIAYFVFRKIKILMNFFIVLFLVLFSSKELAGYTFNCLDGCECDTDDEAIHCHDNADRERVQLPPSRLRGFTVLGLTQNNIKVLPSEELLLEKLPDLTAVDVEGNVNFDCSTLDHYSRITVMSDCGKTPAELESDRAKLPTKVEPSEDCDLQCVAEKRARELRDYIKRLWEMIKAKVKKLAKKHGVDKFIDDVGNFFNDVGERISNINL